MNTPNAQVLFSKSHSSIELFEEMAFSIPRERKILDMRGVSLNVKR